MALDTDTTGGCTTWFDRVGDVLISGVQILTSNNKVANKLKDKDYNVEKERPKLHHVKGDHPKLMFLYPKYFPVS